MRRYADIISALLSLQRIRGIWPFIVLTLLSLTPSFIAIYFGALESIMRITATFSGLMLFMQYLLIIIMASGELARLGYSLKEPSMVELFTSRGISMNAIFTGLWISSSLRFLLFIAIGGLTVDIASYLAGVINFGEAILLIAGLALSASLTSIIAIVLSFFIPPGEAQYWIGMTLYIVLGWIYQKAIWELIWGSLPEFGSSNFIRLLLFGFVDPTVLAGEALSIFVGLVILAAISGELTWERG